MYKHRFFLLLLNAIKYKKSPFPLYMQYFFSAWFCLLFCYQYVMCHIQFMQPSLWSIIISIIIVVIIVPNYLSTTSHLIVCIYRALLRTAP